MTPEQETLGADLVEHGVGSGDCSYDKQTNQIIWHTEPIRTAHLCDACELLQQQLGLGCNDVPSSTREEPAQRLTGSQKPSCVLRHIERRQSQTRIVTYGVKETDRKTFQAYCSRQGTPSRTLGKRLTWRNWTNLRQSVSKRMGTGGRRQRMPKSQSIVADIEKEV